MIVPLAVWQFLSGGMGGLIRALVGIAKSQTFNPETFKFQWKTFLFTIVVSIMTGQMAAVVFNADWRTSLLAGYAGSDFLESLYKLRFTQMSKT